MEHYEKKISFLGENIQTIRKHRGMKQQELADKIGINMQSLSKIERGVNYPTFDTLEKIMDVLGVTPNELYQENGSILTTPNHISWILSNGNRTSMFP